MNKLKFGNCLLLLWPLNNIRPRHFQNMYFAIKRNIPNFYHCHRSENWATKTATDFVQIIHAYASSLKQIWNDSLHWKLRNTHSLGTRKYKASGNDVKITFFATYMTSYFLIYLTVAILAGRDFPRVFVEVDSRRIAIPYKSNTTILYK